MARMVGRLWVVWDERVSSLVHVGPIRVTVRIPGVLIATVQHWYCPYGRPQIRILGRERGRYQNKVYKNYCKKGTHAKPLM